MRMQRIYVLTMAACALVACAGKDDVQAGPTLEQVELSTDVGQASNTDTDPELDSETGDASYDISVQLSFEAGSDTEDDTSDFQPTSVTMTITLDGTPTSVSLDNGDGDGTFSSTQPVSIPISAKGKTLTVHAQGVDARGLHSNTVDFSVALN